MSWHFLERWLERANQHSTLIGKFWITYLIVCRMVIIGSIGDRVYADEQSEFRCNTQQPGCVQICYNKFAPISHVRFWGFQLMCVTMPSVGFIVYSGHKAKEKMRVEQSKKQEAKAQLMAEKSAKPDRPVPANGNSGNGTIQNAQRLILREMGTQTHRHHDDDSDSSGNKNYRDNRRRHHRDERDRSHTRRSPRSKDEREERYIEPVQQQQQQQPPPPPPPQSYPPPSQEMGLQSMMENHAKTVKEQTKEESKKKCGIMVGKSVSQHFHLYMANVFFRLTSEATFGILQLWLFGYQVKEMFKCEGFPCPHVVDCFISRPAEKTIFLNFMLGFTVFCVILNLMEFKYLCYLFFKARVKLTSTARTSAPLMPPKPPTYPGPYPAYEPLGFEMPDPRHIPIGPSGTPPKRDLGATGVPQPRSGLDQYGMPPPPTTQQQQQQQATSQPLSDKSGKKWKLPKRK